MVGVRARGVVVVPAADHGLDVAGLGVDRHEAQVELAGALGLELADSGLLRLGLHGGIDRGLHREPALEDHVGRELLLQEALHVVHEVGVGEGAALGGLGHIQGKGLGLGGVMLLLRDHVVGEHAVEHRVAALDGEVGVDRGVVGARGVGQAHEEGGLGEGEVVCGLREVGLGCGLDAVGAVAVVDGVEVHHQDLVFGVDLLHLDRDEGLADLALDGDVELLLGEDRVAHELLGDGGGTLGAAQELHERGAGDADGVDAAVLVEALVLGGDGALQHVGGDLVGGDGHAVLDVKARDLVAVGVQDLGGLAHHVEVGVRVIGQVGEPAVDIRDHAHRKGDTCDEQEAEDRTEDYRDGVRLGVLPSVALARAHAYLQECAETR